VTTQATGCAGRAGTASARGHEAQRRRSGAMQALRFAEVDHFAAVTIARQGCLGSHITRREGLRAARLTPPVQHLPFADRRLTRIESLARRRATCERGSVGATEGRDD